MSESLKVLLVLDTYRPHQAGTIVVVEELTTRLRSSGHSVGWLLPVGTDEPQVELDYLAYCPAVPKFGRLPTNSIFPTIRVARMASRYFAPSVVHAHHPFGAFLQARILRGVRGSPVVFTAHTMFTEYGHYMGRMSPWASRGSRLALIAASRRADAVIVPSVTGREYLKSIGFDSPVDVIPTRARRHFHPPTRMQRETARAALGISQNRLVLAVVGRIEPEKRPLAIVDELVRADTLAVTLLMVGEGSLKVEAVSRATGQLQVVATGWVEGRHLLAAYHAADAVLSASTTEMQGLVIAEAQACGVPVIVPRRSAQAELVRDGANGTLVRPDLSDLREAIERLSALTIMADSEHAPDDTSADDDWIRSTLDIYRRVIA